MLQVDAAETVRGNDEFPSPQVAQRGAHMEKINGDDSVGLDGQELSPGRVGSAGCWVDAGALEGR
jgi:hypothetical protein